MPEIIDISVPLSPELTTWPGDEPPQRIPLHQLEQGHPSTETRLVLNSHNGTHLDAPGHMILGGASVDSFRLEDMIGPCQVVACPDTKVIDVRDLERCGLAPGTTRVLFRTDNSLHWQGAGAFAEDFTALGFEAAEWLVAHGVRLVGMDYLSVEPFHSDGRVHKLLLRAGVILLEGLRLGHVTPGAYELICLPLHLPGCEAAPARAVLRPLGREAGTGRS